VLRSGFALAATAVRKAGREHDKGDVAVPGGPVADLVVVQADLAFCGLEALFDAPPGPGDANRRGQGRLAR
jgi:hypothetical protein